MPLYGPSTATATVALNTNSVSITGMDLSAVVQPGMTINFGSRERAMGDAYIINTVVPNGTNGGTLTTAGTIPTAFNSSPFLIDTRGFNGTDASYAAAVSLKLLQVLSNLLGPATNLFAGSRQLVLDKVASSAIARIAFAIAGRTWGDIVHRPHTYTPPGGAQVNTELLVVRAFPDGVTPADVLLVDLSNGTADLRKGAATMVAGSTVDLGSTPTGKVAITGGAGVNINSFGAIRHLERLVRFVDGGATLVHNAATLDLPGGGNIVTRAGDRLHAVSDGAGNWRVHAYERADGTPLILPSSTQRASFRNRVVNGNFAINQRVAAAASTSYPAGAYILDRWKAGAGGVTLSWSRAASGDVTVTITAGSLCQTVEGAIYLPEGGTYTLSWQGTAKAGFNGGTIAQTSPWVIGGLPAGANELVEFGVGTLTLVQLEPGAVATSFEYRDDELERCLRYYEKSYPANVAPGTVNRFGPEGLFLYGIGGVGGVYVSFKKTKRAAPTVTLYSPGTGLPGKMFDLSAVVDRAALVDLTSDRKFRGYCQDQVAGGVLLTEFHWTASAEL